MASTTKKALLSGAEASSHENYAKVEDVPIKTRFFVFMSSAPNVFRYNTLHVTEQAYLFISVGVACGIGLRLALADVQSRNVLTAKDPLGAFVAPLLLLLSLWLVQERLAVWGATVRDPLTKITPWKDLLGKVLTAPETIKVHTPVEGRQSEVPAEDSSSLPLLSGPPKRDFNASQEASIAILEQKYFNPSDSSSWIRSRLLCVDDNARWAAIRALDARKWKVDQASTLIENNLKWREKENTDDIFSRVLPEKDVFAVRSAMGDGYFGLDRTGSPIYWCPAGSVVLSALRSQVSLENIVTVHVQLMEYNQRVWFKELSRAQGRCVYQSTCVLDLKGFSSRNTAGGFMECMQAITSVDKDYYYENLFRVYILHAPMFFRFFWQSVSQLLQPETREKFVFLTNTKSLQKYIDPKVTPKQFGGDYAGDDAIFKSECGETWHSRRMDSFLAEWRDAKTKVAETSFRTNAKQSDNKKE